jgi:hypothetical protein
MQMPDFGAVWYNVGTRDDAAGPAAKHDGSWSGSILAACLAGLSTGKFVA